MFIPFFTSAMTAPARQWSFRRAVVSHTLLVAGLCWATAVADSGTAVGIIGQMMLVLGIVEGAAIIGWRLTQLPKSQALEFFLVSPIQPRRLFLIEATVDIARFALVSFSGWPILGLLVMTGRLDFPDLYPFALMPLLWGVVAGIGLTAWVYEPVHVRRIGERLGLLGVVFYLIVGVLAAGNFRSWLLVLPESVGLIVYNFVLGVHELNPFGVVRYWFEPGKNDTVAWERMVVVNGVACVGVLLLLIRAAFRLRGHFHDRHYKPIDSSRAAQTELIGDRPLSWWTVRRVMEYSGRVNLWLANGFALVYAAYIVAGDAWPAWMGRLVFQMFENWGGAPVVATALAVLSAVPAVYQYGLWDSTPADRCRRLELLLLTDLRGSDYAHAAYSAAWKRGRAYLIGAVALWLALAISGRIGWGDAAGSAVGMIAFWAFAFGVGFRGFASGHQTNGVASLIVLGLPVALYVLLHVGMDDVAALLPTATTYLPAARGISWPWAVGTTLLTLSAGYLIRRGLLRCESDLRRWYDANQGQKSAA